METSLGFNLLELLQKLQILLPSLLVVVVTCTEFIIQIFKVENGTAKQIISYCVSAIICVGLTLLGQIDYGIDNIWISIGISLVISICLSLMANGVADIEAVKKFLDYLMSILKLKRVN